MKTLGIFGDSFGDDTIRKTHESWIDHLKCYYKVKNFSEAGSSLWFSYKNFLNNYKNFDKIIFLVTTIGRITLPETTNFKIFKHTIFHNIEYELKQHKNINKKEIEIMYSYYLNIYDYEKEISHHKFIIEDIKKIKNDIILYPCFKESIIDSDDFPLWEITKFEDVNSKFALPNSIYKKLNMFDTRCCHLTEPNHRIVSNMFLKKLNNENFILKTDDLIPNKYKNLYQKI